MSRALLRSSTTSSNLSPVDESSTDTANTSVSRIHSSATWSVPLSREANSIIATHSDSHATSQHHPVGMTACDGGTRDRTARQYLLVDRQLRRRLWDRRVRRVRLLLLVRRHPEAGTLAPPEREPAMNTVRRELADLTFGERNRDCVGLHLLDGADGDRDLASPPQMTPFQNEVGDLLVVVDGEPADVANILPFARHDAAGAPELDFTFRDAVEDNADVLLDERRLEHSGSLEVGKCQHIRGPHVPVEICNGRLSKPEIREFVHAREGAELLLGTAQGDLGPTGRRVRALDRYEQ